MIYVLSKCKKNITKFHLKITVFTAVKNRSILHRRVNVISLSFDFFTGTKSLKIFAYNLKTARADSSNVISEETYNMSLAIFT